MPSGTRSDCRIYELNIRDWNSPLRHYGPSNSALGAAERTSKLSGGLRTTDFFISQLVLRCGNAITGSLNVVSRCRYNSNPYLVTVRFP
jgi:hypothetical protein